MATINNPDRVDAKRVSTAAVAPSWVSRLMKLLRVDVLRGFKRVRHHNSKFSRNHFITEGESVQNNKRSLR